VIIADNDSGSLPVVTVTATDASASETAPNPGKYTLSRTGSTAAAVTVFYTMSGSATKGIDYTNFSGTVTIPAGSATGTMTLTPTDDTIYEGSETAILTLSANAAYVVGLPSSATVTIADNDNSTPALASALRATPNPAIVSQAVSLSAAASDSNGNDLTYTWDFGDGSGGIGSSIAHAYAIAGTYAATLVVSNENGEAVSSSVSVVVNSSAGGESPDRGSDVSIDGGAGRTPPVVKTPMSVSSLSGKVNFASSGRDACSLTGTVPDLPAKFDPTGVNVRVNVGGATGIFTLNSKGKAISDEGSISLTLKPSVRNKATGKVEFLGGPVNFKLQLKNGTWSDDWADEGVDPTADATGKSMTITVDLTLNGKTFTSNLTKSYSAKKGKGSVAPGNVPRVMLNAGTDPVWGGRLVVPSITATLTEISLPAGAVDGGCWLNCRR
jgi:PKD repeat protein